MSGFLTPPPPPPPKLPSSAVAYGPGIGLSPSISHNRLAKSTLMGHDTLIELQQQSCRSGFGRAPLAQPLNSVHLLGVLLPLLARPSPWPKLGLDSVGAAVPCFSQCVCVASWSRINTQERGRGTHHTPYLLRSHTGWAWPPRHRAESVPYVHTHACKHT